MGNNYSEIIHANLDIFYRNRPEDEPERRLPASREQDRFHFKAFGEHCQISPGGIRLNGEKIDDPRGIIISLYARGATDSPCVPEPLKAYREFDNTMPYAGAFHSHTEQILIPRAGEIIDRKKIIIRKLDGTQAPPSVGGDGSFLVTPLPKIKLCYIIYEADEDFEAAVTCLYSANADEFLPPDALADLGEYTSRKIASLLT
ncbi:MAG: DUF3786 domain-containing protein [Desulfosudaceae bacterium]